jgi:hypothetical protein
MARIEHVTGRPARSLGDAAVDGLFAGLAAGVLMGVYLFVLGFADGRPAIEVIPFLVIGREITPTTTVLIHLAISGIYGVLFGMVLFLSRRGREPALRFGTGAALGLGYGLILALIARFILLPGSGSYMEGLGWLHLVGAHGLYGLSLGAFIGLGQRKPA